MDRVETDAYYLGIEGEGEREGYTAANYRATTAIEQLTGHLNNAFSTVYGACQYALEAVEDAAAAPYKAEEMSQCDLLRDIFGNPFRPVVSDSAWFTPAVVAIATSIYSDRAFDRMPILADALEEAGCTNADVLLHCRSDGPHVRGCWVVDLVLGKE